MGKSSSPSRTLTGKSARAAGSPMGPTWGRPQVSRWGRSWKAQANQGAAGRGGAGGRGGGVAGAPRKVYAPLGGPGSKPRQGGGGRRPRAAAPTAEGLPLDDPSAALIGEWLDFSGKLKAEKPDLWVELWDFLHLAGQFEQVGYL